MKLSTAMGIMEGREKLRVSYDQHHGNVVTSSSFPAPWEDPLFMFRAEVFALAQMFAEKADSEYVNIVVVGRDFRPVDGPYGVVLRPRSYSTPSPPTPSAPSGDPA